MKKRQSQVKVLKIVKIQESQQIYSKIVKKVEKQGLF